MEVIFCPTSVGSGMTHLRGEVRTVRPRAHDEQPEAERDGGKRRQVERDQGGHRRLEGEGVGQGDGAQQQEPARGLPCMHRQPHAIEPRSHHDVDERQHDRGDVGEAEEATREVVVAHQGGGHGNDRLERVEGHPEPGRESAGQEDGAALDVARAGHAAASRLGISLDAALHHPAPRGTAASLRARGGPCAPYLGTVIWRHP